MATTPLLVVAKSNKSYYNALKYETAKSSEDIQSSILFLEQGECFALVESCISRRNFNIDCSIPTIVVDADEVVFLEEIYKMLMERNVKRPLFKLLIVTSLDHWAGDIFPDSVQSCSDLILQRSQVHGLFESERITRLTLELLESNMLQCQFVVVGNVYGGNGLDFSSLLWSIWNQDSIATETFTNPGHIGCVFSPDLFNLLLNLRLPISSSENQSLVITAFEDPSICFSNIVTEYCTKLNGADKNKSNVMDLSSLVLRSYDLSSFKPFYTNLIEINHIGANFQSLWDTFIHENGLNPINILVTGPPRSRKSEIAKDVAERLSLQVISVPNSVVFAFELFEKLESSEFEKEEVNVDKLQEALRMLTSAIESKVAEQSATAKKGGKDKNSAVVTTDTKLEVSQITEALCYSLPDEIIKVAISVQLTFERLSKRKGFVLDVWERDLFTEFDDLFSLRSRFCQEGSHSKSALFNCVIEVQATSRLIMDRQLETMGPQQAKSKEGQATIKTLEGTLEAYNLKVTKRELGEEIFVDSAKVFDTLYLNDPQYDGVIKMFPNSLNITDFSFDNLFSELTNMYSKKFGRSIPWLNTSTTIEKINTDTSDEFGPTTSQMVENEPSEESKENTNKISLNQSDGQTVKYNDFLANTSLPIITSTMVAIIRENPDDPIMFLAESLLAESERRQELAYSDAFKKFMELLNS